MRFERSAGVIIFRKENGKPKILLLHYKYKSEYWDFPKGHIEKGETEKQTAIREVKEETGITDLKFVFGFNQKISYWFKDEKELVKKEVIYFLAETKQKEVKISSEHIGYGWFDYEDAMKLLKPESKKVLEKAKKFLF